MKDLVLQSKPSFLPTSEKSAFSNSLTGHTTLVEGPASCPAVHGPTQNGLIGIFGGSLSLYALSGHFCFNFFLMLQVLCVHILISCFAFFEDFFVLKCVCLCISVCFLCFFFDSFTSVSFVLLCFGFSYFFY